MTSSRLHLIAALAVFFLILGPGALLAEEGDAQVPESAGEQKAPVAEDDSDTETGEQKAPVAEDDSDTETGEQEAFAAEKRATRAQRVATPGAHQTFEDYEARVRFTAEPAIQPPSEGHARIGLFGVDLDVRPYDEWWHIGVGGFGAAAQGNLGGFFGGGLGAGVRLPIRGPVALEAGAMMGAAGGSGAETGTGLFLRPRGGLHLDLTEFGGYVRGAGLNVSKLYFPTGEFSSTHLSLSFELDAPTSLRSGRGARPAPRLSDRAYGASPRTFRLTSHGYFLLANRTQDQAGEALSSPRAMLGLEYREFFTSYFYGVIEPRAQVAGGDAGFAEVTVGAGVSYPLDDSERVRVFGSGGVGGAGGGGVLTGSGILLRGALGIDVDLPGALHMAIDAGIQDAPRRGSYTAISTGLRIGLTQDVIRPRSYSVRALTAEDEVSATAWRARATHQTMFSVPESGEESIAQLAGLKVDHFLGEHLFVTLQAASSYAGLERAALSTGTVGVGGVGPDWRGIQLTGEARIGAAGGGGVGAGSGLLLQPMGGVHVDITDSLGIDLLGGWSVAPSGDMSSGAVDVGVTYTFTTPRIRTD